MEAQQEQQGKMQLMQLEMEVMAQKANIELTHSQVQANMGSAVERMSQVNENNAMATEKKTTSLLNVAKSINELDRSQLDNIEKTINLINQISLQSKQQEAEQPPMSTQEQQAVTQQAATQQQASGAQIPMQQ